MKIAVVMTCHNRREKTLASLSALFNQIIDPEILVQVYLVDDGSTDGTTEAVLTNYPQVKVLQGEGSLFWNGGMRLAFAEALKVGYDYYLWLNDDTILDPDALSRLLNTHFCCVADGNSNSLIVGSTRDQVTGELTYGGLVRSSPWRPLKYKLVDPGKKPQICETMNGNCVLIPHEVAMKVGNLDNAFTHKMGDYDYGLRANKLACSIWVAPGYVGTCSKNSLTGTWTDIQLSSRERLKKVVQPKGLPPREWKVFTKRYAGTLWYIYWLFPYAKLLISSVFGKLQFLFYKEIKADL